MIFTFYSYKGGVGRTMALANVAELLYQRGLKVLMVDFDLEAPGLERFFDVSNKDKDEELEKRNIPELLYSPNEVIEQRGVIDLLISYKESFSFHLPNQEAENTSKDSEQDKFPFPVESIDNFIVPLYAENKQGGKLYIIPSGCRGEEKFLQYVQKVHSFDWNDFYDHYNGKQFFEWFRKKVVGFADVVLVDSRTGVTEMGGVCTYQLADVVVMFVAPNGQNIYGSLKMAQSLSNNDLITKGRNGRKLSLVIAPSRVDNSEKRLLDNFQSEFDEKFANYIPERMNTRLKSLQKSAFLYLKIPYVPFYSFKEKVTVRDADKASASDLSEAYENLVSTLAILSRKLYKKMYPKTSLVYSLSLSTLCKSYLDAYPDLEPYYRQKRVFNDDQDTLRTKIMEEWNNRIPTAVNNLITAIYEDKPINKEVLEEANNTITDYINATLDLPNDDQVLDDDNLDDDNIEGDDIQSGIESNVSEQKQNDSVIHENKPLEEANHKITDYIYINETPDWQNDDQVIDNPLDNDNVEGDDDIQSGVESNNDSFLTFIRKIFFGKTEST
ncbi:MAG: AAA family ATPase [Nostocales cyanobacterium LacPavin_0920_SED1_MAG_38_18]|jgi:MinD-like ATPase involved in chromosome partitioning or flagellar assembly|nr:AAA family ATPase [Nostocales cyanobacterium LacPavin_0920_SED1_MAG_38_18]